VRRAVYDAPLLRGMPSLPLFIMAALILAL
jgi:hypothetical protein